MTPELLCPVLVGRDTELARLTAMLDGPGGTAFVVGEAGIGKTRMVRALAECAGARGTTVLAGRCVPGRPPAPYRPLAEALATAGRRHGLPDPAGFGPYRFALGPLVPEWRRAERGGGPPEPAESGVVLGEGVLRLLAAFGSSVVLVLEDLHWADPESLDVLTYLADHADEQRLVCVGTSRPEPGPGRDLIDSLTGRRAAVTIGLGPLDGPDVVAVAHGCLDTDCLPSGLDDLLARADGVPFLVEELIRSAVDAGGLVRSRAGWEIRADAAQVVPRTFAETVERRMAALATADREALAAAAVLGRRCDPGLIAEVVERSDREVAAALLRGRAEQLLTEDGRGLLFRHALTRDAVLAGLGSVARAGLSWRARRAVEARHPGLPGDWTVVAAELALAAGDVDDAAALLVVAGRRALADDALTSAAALLDRARQLRPDDVDAAALRVEVAARSGDIETAFRVGGEVLDRRPDPAGVVRLRLRLAEAASAASRWADAEEQLTHAGALRPDASARAEMEALRAHVLLGMAQPREAERAAALALATAERHDLAEPACLALEVLGRVARTRDLAAAERAFARQLAVAQRHRKQLWAVRASHELGTIDLMRENRRDRLEQARSLAAEAGALAVVATLDLQLAGSSWLLLDGPGCRAAATRCLETARRHRLGLLEAEALNLLARGHGLSGDREAMERTYAELGILQRPEFDLRAAPETARGMVALLDDDRSTALRHLDAAIRIERGGPLIYVRPYWYIWAVLRTVDGAAASGDAERAEVRAMNPPDSPLARAWIAYGDAVAAGRRGDVAAADRMSAAAGADLAPAGLTPHRHLVERLVAESALADGWGEPARWLAEAAVWFRRAGYDRVAGGCRSLLRAAGVPLPRPSRHDGVPAELAALGVTAREADVLDLVVDGLTNREIAARLVLSVRTVDKHVEHLLAKTGSARRAELRALRT